MFGMRAVEAGRPRTTWVYVGAAIYVVAALIFNAVFTMTLIRRASLQKGMEMAEAVFREMRENVSAATVFEQGYSMSTVTSLFLFGVASSVFAAGITYLNAPWLIKTPHTTPMSGESANTRSRFLRVFLILLGLFGAASTVGNLLFANAIAARLEGAPEWASVGIHAIGVLGVIMLIGVLATWRWKKWGIYMIVATGAVAFLFNLVLTPGPAAFAGLLGIGLVTWLASRQWDDFS